MAAPSGTVWGSTQGSYGKIGLYVGKSSTATTTSVTVEVWFWSKYSVSDTANTLYYDCKSSTGSATTSRGSLSVQTTVATGSGWSTSNQVKLKTYTYSYTRGTAAFNRYVYAKLADIDAVIDRGGSTMSVSTTFSVPALTSYSVKYNANGGTGAPSAQTKHYGKSLTLSSTKPTRTGYSFQGWSTANDSSVEYAAGASYTANAAVTLYAVWKVNTYSVKFDANGGTGAPSTQTKTYGVTLKLSATKPTRTNYNFLGWSTSKTATTATYAAGGNYTSNSATTLYAVWELAYVRPRITNLSGARCIITDEGNVISEEGTSAHIKFNYACDQALKSILIEWESVNNSGSKTIDVTESSGTVSEVIGDNSLSTESTYTIRITVTDANGYSSVLATINGLLLAIDVLPKNAGISFGKPAELKDHADFNYTIYPRKGFKNVPIEENMDLDSLITPNTYVSQNKATYEHCPVSSGTFKMDVSHGGMEGQIHQTLTYTNKTDFKIYHRQYHGGSWGDWKCIYSLSGNILWDCATTTNGTGWYMTAGHTCNLTQKISDQPHGIVLIFALYADGEAKNEQIVEYTIPKASVKLFPGGGHSIPLLTPWKNAVKYLYINDTTVTGNDKNNQSFTVGGITYTNNAFTLRYIIGF